MLSIPPPLFLTRSDAELQVILSSRFRKGEKSGMQLEKVCMAALSILSVSAVVAAGPSGGAIIGRVTYTGTPAKPEPINMSKQPECVKMYSKPRMTEKVVTGPGNTLQNHWSILSALFVLSLFLQPSWQLCTSIENKCLRWTSDSSSKSPFLQDFNQYAPHLSEVPGYRYSSRTGLPGKNRWSR
jgi:hypothetical protein